MWKKLWECRTNMYLVLLEICHSRVELWMPNFGEIMFRMNNYCDQMSYVERSTSTTDEKMTIVKFLVCRGFLLGENNTSCTIALWYGSYTVHGRYRWRHLSNGETLLVYSKLAQSLILRSHYHDYDHDHHDCWIVTDRALFGQICPRNTIWYDCMRSVTIVTRLTTI